MRRVRCLGRVGCPIGVVIRGWGCSISGFIRCFITFIRFSLHFMVSIDPPHRLSLSRVVIIIYFLIIPTHLSSTFPLIHHFVVLHLLILSFQTSVLPILYFLPPHPHSLTPFPSPLDFPPRLPLFPSPSPPSPPKTAPSSTPARPSLPPPCPA